MKNCEFFASLVNIFKQSKQSVKNPKSQVILIDCQQFSELIGRFILLTSFGFPGSFILKVSLMAHLKKLNILHAMCANNLTFWSRNMFHFWSILIIKIPWDIIVEAWGSKAWLEIRDYWLYQHIFFAFHVGQIFVRVYLKYFFQFCLTYHWNNIHVQF